MISLNAINATNAPNATNAINMEEVKKRLINVYDPIAIYIFGSYAWGTPTEDSDLDLLVVVRDSIEKPQKKELYY